MHFTKVAQLSAPGRWLPVASPAARMLWPAAHPVSEEDYEAALEAEAAVATAGLPSLVEAQAVSSECATEQAPESKDLRKYGRAMLPTGEMTGGGKEVYEGGGKKFVWQEG